MEWNAYLVSVNAGLGPDVHMAAMAWMTNDPDTLPALTLRSDAQPPKGFNSGWYENPEVDALVDRARRVTNVSERALLYRELDALVFEEAPWVFVASYKLNLALRSRFSGVRLNPSFLLDLSDARVR
jgi:peptide/nickel transport system substrate-binding protein